MNALILGAGKVGYSIASLLSKERHHVTVVEPNPDRARVVEDALDVRVVVGNGACSEIINKCNIKSTDLLVAVTAHDEVNMLACLLAKQAGVPKTVARIRNPEYAMDENLLKNPSLGIDLAINPEKVTAKEISQLLHYPEAMDVNYYADGKLLMLGLRVQEDNPIIGKLVKELSGTKDYVIVAILRQNKVVIPRGDDVIGENDQLLIMMKKEKVKDVEGYLGFTHRKIESCMILGGNRLTYYLAQYLLEEELDVKIIEPNYEECKKLSGLLDGGIILNGDIGDIDLLRDEGISDTDALIALTDDDKLNVLTCLLAKQLGAKNPVAQIRRSDYMPLIQQVGIGICVSPQQLTAEAILKFVRKGKYLSISINENGGAEAYEVVLTEKMTKLVNKKIMDIRFPKGAIIGSIFREDEAIIPSGSDVLLAGDRLVVFTSAERIGKIDAIFS